MISVRYADDQGTAYIYTDQDGINWHIPSYDNSTYIAQKMRDWVESGNEILPYIVPIEETLPPDCITRRQCAIEMRERGFITPLEALNMTKTGEIPAFVSAAFAAMSEEDRILAETDFAAANYFRNNPLLIALMSATGATSEDIDQFFRDAFNR